MNNKITGLLNKWKKLKGKKENPTLIPVQSDLKPADLPGLFLHLGQSAKTPDWVAQRETETSAETQSGRDDGLEGVSREPTACCRAERSESELEL